MERIGRRDRAAGHPVYVLSSLSQIIRQSHPCKIVRKHRKAESVRLAEARLPAHIIPQAKMLACKGILCRPSIRQLRKAQVGEAQRLAEQTFLHVFFRMQKCLPARAFLRRLSIVQLRKAQRGKARRLAEQGFLHILYRIFRQNAIEIPKTVSARKPHTLSQQSGAKIRRIPSSSRFHGPRFRSQILTSLHCFSVFR